MGAAARPVVRFWQGETHDLGGGLTLIRCGGHYEGGQVLHWARAPRAADRRHRARDPGSPLRRLHVLVPEPDPAAGSKVQAIAAALEPYEFDTIYGAWWDRVRRARRVRRRSALAPTATSVRSPIPGFPRSRLTRQVGVRERGSRARCRAAPAGRSASKPDGRRDRHRRAPRAGEPRRAARAARSGPARAEEEREEEQVGDAEIRGRVLAGNRERERQHVEDVRVVLDDVLRRAAPDRVGVDPRDDRTRRARPRRASRSSRGTTSRAASLRASRAKFAKTLTSAIVSTAASTAKASADGQQPARVRAAAARAARARRRPGSGRARATRRPTRAPAATGASRSRSRRRAPERARNAAPQRAQ